MQSPSTLSTVSVLLVTSDASISASLGSVLNSDYQLQTVTDEAISSPNNLPIEMYDILLFAKAALDQSDLDRISQTLDRSPIPVLVFVESDPNRVARSAIRAGVTSFVVDGLEANRVPTLIEVTMERFKLSEALRSELLKSQEELAARKIIERAKGLLMDKKQLNEQEAYRTLREIAMRQSKPIKEVAETLLMYSDILP